MKRKNGFTLIEVLTVIIVLAIIALIAVPVIMGLVGKAQKSAFTDSAYALVKAGDLLYSTNEMEGAILERKTFTFPNDTEDLDVKGELPTGGEMKVYENGEIAMAVTNGKYCATKKYGSKEVVVTEDTENCELPKLELGDIIYFDPTLGEKGMLCTEGDYLEKNSKTGHKEGCMRWYVYNSDGNESKLILDHNTTGKFAPDTDISVELLMQKLSEDTKNWKAEADLIEIDELLNLIPWYKNKEYTDINNWYNEYINEYQERYKTVVGDGRLDGRLDGRNEKLSSFTPIQRVEFFDELLETMYKNHSNLLVPKFFQIVPSDVCTDIDLIPNTVLNNCTEIAYWTKSVYDSETIWMVADILSYPIVPVYKTEKKVGIRPIITIAQ